MYAARPPKWAALEDKVVIDAFWDRAGIARAPSMIVPVRADALADAAAALDRGAGTAWAGDARDGWHGGAECLRWIRSPDDVPDGIAFFESRCDRVRVMPFLDGIPCSIHGIVFPDAVIVFRPCELVTLRRPGRAALLYAGVGTFWDPEPADREVMRDAARRVGAALRDRVGYRGAFTVDGVMTAEGFRPTELNARFGAALGVQMRSIPNLPLVLIDKAVREAEPIDWRPHELERLVTEAADERRGGGAWTTVKRVWSETETHGLCAQDDGYRFAREGESADADLVCGPSGVGGFVRFQPDPALVPVGPSIAPRVVAALELAERTFELGLGLLEPAPRVR